MRTKHLAPLILFLTVATPCLAADLEWVRVADDNCSFVLGKSGEKFTPWGFNYDHDPDGRLLEDYWDEHWATVQADFEEMKRLGANVVRIHLQFGKFMDAADKPDPHSLKQLERLVRLAEETGLYVDLTGLGCYHEKDVPPWYDKLDEQERWKAQAVFWEAVAKTCAKSPAIFCYDLMNEPVVPGGDKKRDGWLGPGFGGKHFVQYITLDRAGRERPEIARNWIRTLVTAIRRHDKRHLVTVGLVPWSLDKPGLTSGFVPEKIAGDLDFIAVHIYPEKGKMDEAIETLKGFAAVGKPVVIEEIFPLKCGPEELGQFIDKSRDHAAGWIGFYWGKTPDELRPAKTIPEAITLSWLELFQEKTPQILGERSQPQFRNVTCEGTYPHHLQGVCTDERESIFWSFTTKLVKTDLQGNVVKKVAVANHHGDLCHQDGKIFVAVNLGKFNDPKGNADSWVYVYAADDLSFIAKAKTPEVVHGAGGMAYHDGKFMVVGGLPAGVNENYVYEYDSGFKFMKKHVLKSGHTHLGIQTAAFADGHWWFGCYGDPEILLKADESLQKVERFEFDCSLGIVEIGSGKFLVGRGNCTKEKGCSGKLVVAKPDEKRGLILEDEPAVSFQQGDGKLQIAIGGQQIVEYISTDDKIQRPYFRHLRTLSGLQVTRNHPPIKGQDLDDHPTMHTGLWLAFGDLGGADFWRNKGQVRHVRFVEPPKGNLGSGSFTAQNAYEADEKIICTENCQITISVRPKGYLIDWTSTFLTLPFSRCRFLTSERGGDHQVL